MSYFTWYGNGQSRIRAQRHSDDGRVGRWRRPPGRSALMLSGRTDGTDGSRKAGQLEWTSARFSEESDRSDSRKCPAGPPEDKNVNAIFCF